MQLLQNQVNSLFGLNIDLNNYFRNLRRMDKKAFVVALDQHNKDFQRLLPGKPQTFGMKSGRVYLEPLAQCPEHSTHEKEELLVFLSGQGQAIIKGQQPLEVGQGKIAYIPPQTLHSIKNTSSTEPLIYIYCVAVADTNAQ